MALMHWNGFVLGFMISGYNCKVMFFSFVRFRKGNIQVYKEAIVFFAGLASSKRF